MNTPWGKSDNRIPIVYGVNLVNTPSHGGVVLTRSAANKHLSAAAIAKADVYANNLFFEEDVDYAIVFYDRPDFYRTLEQHEADQIRRDGLSNTAPYDHMVVKHEQNALKTDEAIRAEFLPVLSLYRADYLQAIGVEPLAAEFAKYQERHQTQEVSQ